MVELFFLMIGVVVFVLFERLEDPERYFMGKNHFSVTVNLHGNRRNLLISARFWMPNLISIPWGVQLSQNLSDSTSATRSYKRR